MIGPIQFSPWLRTMVWGGNKISKYKKLQQVLDGIGESWEISAVDGHESVVAEGVLQGRNLPELVEEFKGNLVGNKIYAQYGNQFPLLIKIIDAQNDLSIQVHPNDELATKFHGEGFFGKTEMWYVIDAEPGAFLYSGLKQSITREEYRKRIAEGSICEVLAKHEVKPGDVFFIPAGRVHAICSGIVLAEVQQTSDLTYRIFDYNRKGLDGKPRELHTEKAAEAIDYNVYSNYKTSYSQEVNTSNDVLTCPFFTIQNVITCQPLERQLKSKDSFVVCMAIEGDSRIRIKDSEEEILLQEGSSCLIPACDADYEIIPSQPGQRIKMLEAFIN